MCTQWLYRYLYKMKASREKKCSSSQRKNKRINFESIRSFFLLAGFAELIQSISYFFGVERQYVSLVISCLINWSNSCFLPSYKNICIADRRLLIVVLKPKSNFFSLHLQSMMDFLSRMFHFVLRRPLQMNQNKMFFLAYDFFRMHFRQFNWFNK